MRIILIICVALCLVGGRTFLCMCMCVYVYVRVYVLLPFFLEYWLSVQTSGLVAMSHIIYINRAQAAHGKLVYMLRESARVINFLSDMQTSWGSWCRERRERGNHNLASGFALRARARAYRSYGM